MNGQCVSATLAITYIPCVVIVIEFNTFIFDYFKSGQKTVGCATSMIIILCF